MIRKEIMRVAKDSTMQNCAVFENI